ncbi:MAG: glutathione S-transferase [Synechococcaceae cyanobacterium]|nr:glutathione S-transferase [Synechococcaceae cyanobacterium]
MTLSLYGGSRSRASMVRWYLEEKGIAYSWQPLAMQDGEHRQAAFLAINPFGKVPALVDSSFDGPDSQPLRLSESGAILLHLAEHHAGEFGASASGGEARAAVLRSLTAQWLLYAKATFATALFQAKQRPEDLQQQLAVLDRLLQDGRTLLSGTWGDLAWGAADCALQAHLAYLPLFAPQVDLEPFAAVRRCICGATERPLYRQVNGLP